MTDLISWNAADPESVAETLDRIVGSQPAIHLSSYPRSQDQVLDLVGRLGARWTTIPRRAITIGQYAIWTDGSRVHVKSLRPTEDHQAGYQWWWYPC